MDNRVKEAMLFAQEKHKGQKYGNKDYFLFHICGVADSVNNAVPNEESHKEEMLTVAYLHDVLEDCDATLEEITERFGVFVAEKVDLLTKKEGQFTEEYLSAITTSRVATIVKLHDSLFNATQCLVDGDKKRFRKYTNYIGLLGKHK